MVRDVELRPDPKLDCDLARPCVGERGGGLAELSGWISSSGQPVVAVIARSDGHAMLRTALLSSSLTGVDRQPEKLGFRMWICILGVDCLTVEAVLADGAIVPIAAIRFEWHTSWESGGDSGLHPLSVVGIGRSGTSWMMHLLARHPEVLVAGGHPFEVQAAGYWALQMREKLHAPAHKRPQPSEARSPVPHPLSSGAVVESLEWFMREDVWRAAAQTRDRIKAFYRHIHPDRTHARYFAEKDQHAASNGVLAALYRAARRLILVRDPRDLICSMRAMNESRSVPSFGRELCTSDEEHLHRVMGRFVELHRQWVSRPEGSLLVRYEDLVRRPTDILAEILAFLGIDATARTVNAMLEEGGGTARLTHMTSETAAASIERWRRDLGQQDKQRIERIAAAAMVAFGYNAMA